MVSFLSANKREGCKAEEHIQLTHTQTSFFQTHLGPLAADQAGWLGRVAVAVVHLRACGLLDHIGQRIGTRLELCG